MFIEHLVYTGYCFRQFRGIDFINLYNNPKVGLAVSPSYKAQKKVIYSRSYSQEAGKTGIGG